MRHLDLFSGIGGFALAARWVGWETVGFCEIDPYCQKVLRKHWPDVPIYEDVRELDGQDYKGAVDIITGGFPCQDISLAGKGVGIDGERSGLWSELARIIGEIRPAYAVMENVSALLGRGLDRVAGDLAEIGYDCEWHCIPASAIGAPHRRDRIWIIAYASSVGICDLPECGGLSDEDQHTAEAEQGRDEFAPRAQANGKRKSLADPNGFRGNRSSTEQGPAGRKIFAGDSGIQHPAHYAPISEGIRRRESARQWWIEPNVGRVAHGIPNRTHRLKGLGNAVVPQIPELIFRAINAVQTVQQPVTGETK